MKTQKNLQVFLLLALLLLQISFAVDVDDLECDQIVQCDSDGSEWSSGNRVCKTSAQTNPYAEEVMVTDVRFADYCESGDNISDCITVALDQYETLDSEGTYDGRGYASGRDATICCSFGETTVHSYGIVNDLNSPVDNSITRRWSAIDTDDNTLDACPTAQYNPYNSPDSFNNIRNGSFADPGFYFEQYTEPGFDQAVVINLLDYFFDNETGNRTRYDEVKESLQAERGVFSWDRFDIFSFATENDIDDYLDDVLPSGCVVKQIDCGSSTYTTDLCTAGTGINIRANPLGFFEAFFNKYKTPYLSQSQHTWYYGDGYSFTGYYYWETLYSYDSPNFQTYQGSRTYTNQSFVRILNDINAGANDGVYIVCDGYAEDTTWLKFDNGESYANYTMSYGDQGHLELIKDEDYYWESDLIETNDFSTSNPYVRWDWENNGYDTDWEEINENEHRVESNVSTSTLTLKSEVWGKGGTDTDTLNYKIYDNPDIVFDFDELNDGSFSKPASANFKITAFGNSAYDYGEVEWVCYDYTNDGVYDAVVKVNDSISFNCSPVLATYDLIVGDPKEENIEFNESNTGTYVIKVKAGMSYKNRANYEETLTSGYIVTAPIIIATPNLISSSWTTFVGDTIFFNLADSSSHNIVNAILYDFENDGTYERCFSVVPGDSIFGKACTFNSVPLTNIEDVYVGKASSLGIPSGTSTLKSVVFDDLGYYDVDYQSYTFRTPIINSVINLVSGDYDLEPTDSVTLNAEGSTSENPIHSVCWDLDGDGDDEKAFSTDCGGHYCDGTVDSCFEISPVISANVTISNSDYVNGNYNAIVRVWDDEGYSDTDSDSYVIREYYNSIDINLEYSDFITDVANATSILVYNLDGSVVEEQDYTCYDYETDGTYDVCYAQASGQTHCGLSCTQVSDVLTANIQIDFATINQFGDFTLTALLYNGDTTSNNTRDYTIFFEDFEPGVNTIISSTIDDDDYDDDFIINLDDYKNLSEDIGEDKVWNFQFTALESTPFDEITYSCWDTNLIDDEVWDVCYQVGGGYNAFCGLNCSDLDWYSVYDVPSTGYENNLVYSVSLQVGNNNGTVIGQAVAEFIFDPITSDEEKAVKFTLIVSIFAILLILVTIGLFLIVTPIVLLLAFTGLFRIFRKKDEKETFKKLKD
jgi:hypothetical protein